MQRTQQLRHSMSVLFAGLVMLASSVIVSADGVRHSSAVDWEPLYSSAQDEVWYPPAAVSKKDGGPGGPTICTMDTAGTDGQPVMNPVWTQMYSGQTDRTTFRVCGDFEGQGQVLLTYAGAGKPTDFDYSVPTSLCLDTHAYSDSTPRAIDLYLVQTGAHSPSISSPSILISEQP
jgi:hypothetical protein